MDLKKYLNDKRELVDAFLKGHFRQVTRPELLRESMLYSLFAGGKRVRPILALAAYEACGKDPGEIVPYASSLELIHTYSLIHDDLPAMDDDDLRRGKPTNHRVYGEAMAILAGDALLTEAFCILSDPGYSPGVRERDLLSGAREIGVAAGYRGMVGGQSQDMLSESAEPDPDTLFFIHSHKTAALIRASVRLGAILSACGEEKLSSLTVYGERIGLAFQVVDDILDVEGSTEEMGKTAGADERIKKLTYPRLYGVEKSREIARGLITEALSCLENFPSAADPLREIGRYLLERRN